MAAKLVNFQSTAMCLGALASCIVWNLLPIAAQEDISGPETLIEKTDRMVSEANAPLIAAVKKGDLDVVKLLLDQGANVNALEMATKETRLSVMGTHSVLMLAILHQHPQVASLLIRRGADIYFVEPKERIPTDDSPANKGGVSVLGDIITSGYSTTKPPVTRQFESREISTPLTAAALVGDMETANLLIARGVKVDSRAEGKPTALMMAIRGKNPDMIKLLLKRGADIKALDNRGSTALMWAAEGDKTGSMVRILLEKKASANMQNTYGETALMSAAKAGNVEGVQLLLDKGATVNAADSFGRTALMYAAQNLQPGLLRLLLARGADAAAKQQDGRRALDCAAQALDKAEKAEVIQILKEADTKR